jgi:hypothetical protein
MTTWPDKFKMFRNMPGVKDAIPWHSEIPEYKKWCRNCGGSGILYLFCVTGGPFESAPIGKISTIDGDGKKITVDIIAHWQAGHWYSGINQAAECPICNGSGLNPDYKPTPPKQRELDIEGVLKEPARNYTDV